jgi:hypothetical protein
VGKYLANTTNNGTLSKYKLHTLEWYQGFTKFMYGNQFSKAILNWFGLKSHHNYDSIWKHILCTTKSIYLRNFRSIKSQRILNTTIINISCTNITKHNATYESYTWHMKCIYTTMLDDEHDQGFVNSKEKTWLTTTMHTWKC